MTNLSLRNVVGRVVVFTSLFAPMTAHAEALESDAQLTLSASGVIASGKWIDGTEDPDKSGSVFGVKASWDLRGDANHLGIDLSSIYYAYSDEDRDDRWSNRIAGIYERQVAPTLKIGARADFASRMAALESSSADQAQIQGMLIWGKRKDRVRLSAGWRWRGYRDGSDGSGDGAVAAISWRRRLDKRQFLEISGSYDTIDSTIDRRDYRRYTINAEYRLRPIDKLELGMGLALKNWRYRNRRLGDGYQHDHSWTPKVNVSYEVAKGWFADLEGEMISRNSSDATYDNEIKRGKIGIRKKLYF